MTIGADQHQSPAVQFFPEGKPNIEALQKSIDLQVEYGFAKQKIDVKKFVDLSIVEEAAARLK